MQFACSFRQLCYRKVHWDQIGRHPGRHQLLWRSFGCSWGSFGSIELPEISWSFLLGASQILSTSLGAPRRSPLQSHRSFPRLSEGCFRWVRVCEAHLTKTASTTDNNTTVDEQGRGSDAPLSLFAGKRGQQEKRGGRKARGWLKWTSPARKVGSFLPFKARPGQNRQERSSEYAEPERPTD